jgi:hypothetical protein
VTCGGLHMIRTLCAVETCPSSFSQAINLSVPLVLSSAVNSSWTDRFSPFTGYCSSSDPIYHCSLPKSQCNQHIQTCLRRELASHHKYLQSDVHYCHYCFEWAMHCQGHIKAPIPKRCGTIAYCFALVRVEGAEIVNRVQRQRVLRSML